MFGFNVYLILDIVLSRLLITSFFSVLIAMIIGGVVGVVARIISRHKKPTILPAIVGSFFGTMLIAMLPIWSTPGLSGGGGLGALTIIQMAIQLVPLGAIGGAVVGIVCGVKLSQKRKKQVVLMMLAVTYSMIAITIYTRFTLHCNSELWRRQDCEPQTFSSSPSFEMIHIVPVSIHG